MKKTLLIGTVLLLLGLSTTAEAKHQPGMGGRFDVFYSSLSGHGEWIDCNFGYAWRPRHVAVHWRPYMMGRWVWTDYGWYWSSYEPFGWATYHYGRWIYDDYYGWIWIPDDVWGPAWVEWRYDDAYIGWSPLPPYAVFSFNIGISYNRTWSAPVHYWNFVPYRNFTAVRVNEYVQPVERSRRIFGSTRTAESIRSDDRRVINRGVDVDVIRQRGHVDIRRTDVVQSDRSGSDRIVRSGGRERIEVYRPKIDASNDPGRRDAYDRPQRRIGQDEERVRSQRDVERQDTRGTQRDVRPEVRQDESRGRMQREDQPQVRQRIEREQRGQVRQEQQRIEREQRGQVRQEQQRIEREQRGQVRQEPQRQGGVRSQQMPQTKERMSQPERRVSQPSGRSQERKAAGQEKSRSKGRRPA